MKTLKALMCFAMLLFGFGLIWHSFSNVGPIVSPHISIFEIIQGFILFLSLLSACGVWSFIIFEVVHKLGVKKEWQEVCGKRIRKRA